MQKCLALLLTLLILLQSFSREVVVLDYALHRSQVTELFCVNKDQPQLHCNGKCHLRKQLAKAASADKKAPHSTSGKVKYDALPPQQQRFTDGRSLAAVRPQFRTEAPPLYQYNGRGNVFRPPLQARSSDLTGAASLLAT